MTYLRGGTANRGGWRFWAAALLLLAAWGGAAVAAALQVPPPPTRRVSDYAENPRVRITTSGLAPASTRSTARIRISSSIA